MIEEKKILRIEDSISNVSNGQIAVEATADPDLGYIMFGGKNYLGQATKFLAKDKPARLTTLKLTGATTIGELGILKHDTVGAITGGQLTLTELNDLISDATLGPSYWSRDAGGFLYPVTTTDTLVIGDGTISQPSIGFDNDPTTGFYFANPEIGLTLGSANNSLLWGIPGESEGVCVYPATNYEINASDGYIYIKAFNTTDAEGIFRVESTDEDAYLELYTIASSGDSTTSLKAQSLNSNNLAELNLYSKFDDYSQGTYNVKSTVTHAYSDFGTLTTGTGNATFNISATTTNTTTGYASTFIKATDSTVASISRVSCYSEPGVKTEGEFLVRSTQATVPATLDITCETTSATAQINITSDTGIYLYSQYYMEIENNNGDIEIIADNGEINLTGGTTNGINFIYGAGGYTDIPVWANATDWTNYENTVGAGISILYNLSEIPVSAKFIGSVGYLSGGTITDAGSQTFSVAAGEGFLRSSSSAVAANRRFSWSASNGNSIADGAVKYVFVDYNSGSPQIALKTGYANNGYTEFFLGSVVREGTTLHIVNSPDTISNPITRLNDYFCTKGIERLTGLILGETGTRKITVTEGIVFCKLNKFTLSSINTNVSGSFDSYVDDTLEDAAQTQWDNTSYNNAGTKTALTTDYYGVLWFYRELDGNLILVYGTSNEATVEGAQAETSPTTIPQRSSVQGILIGRIIFKKGESTAEIIESAFDTTFSQGSSTSHNSLTGLQGGTTNEYYHLTATAYNDLVANMPFTATRLFYAGSSNELSQNAYMFYNATQAQFAHYSATDNSTLLLYSDSDKSAGEAYVYIDAKGADSGKGLIQIKAESKDGDADIDIFSTCANSAGGTANISILCTGNGTQSGLEFSGSTITVTGNIDLSDESVLNGALRILTATSDSVIIGQDTGADKTAYTKLEAYTYILCTINGTDQLQIDSDGLEMNNHHIYEIKTATFNTWGSVTASGSTATVEFDEYQKATIDLNNQSSVTITLNEPFGVGNFMLLLKQGSSTATTTFTWATEGTHAIDVPVGGLSINQTTSARTAIGVCYDGSRWTLVATPLEQLIAS